MLSIKSNDFVPDVVFTHITDSNTSIINRIGSRMNEKFEFAQIRSIEYQQDCISHSRHLHFRSILHCGRQTRMATNWNR